mmetsp:Transcript_952/g.1516  ORF Transcript_952/g.1516 Transcript_952/m.1516 type:complete len:220 (-) Transcript_952:778-1437(-)
MSACLITSLRRLASFSLSASIEIFFLSNFVSFFFNSCSELLTPVTSASASTNLFRSSFNIFSSCFISCFFFSWSASKFSRVLSFSSSFAFRFCIFFFNSFAAFSLSRLFWYSKSPRSLDSASASSIFRFARDSAAARRFSSYSAIFLTPTDLLNSAKTVTLTFDILLRNASIFCRSFAISACIFCKDVFFSTSSSSIRVMSFSNCVTLLVICSRSILEK